MYNIHAAGHTTESNDGCNETQWRFRLLEVKDFLNPSKAKRKGDDDNDGGDEKKKREEEEDKEKQAKGKTRRQLKPSWQVGREWLKYDSTKKSDVLLLLPRKRKYS